MVKRTYLIVLILSITSLINGMDNNGSSGNIGTRGASEWFDKAVDSVLGEEGKIASSAVITNAGAAITNMASNAGTITSAISSTATTVEHELESIGLQVTEEISALDPKMVWNAAVVFVSLYTALEGGKWLWRRHSTQPSTISPAYDAQKQKTAAVIDQATKGVNEIGEYISTQQINELVEAKMKEMLATMADKQYVDDKKKEVISTLTPMIQGIGNRVTQLESEVKGLALIIKGDNASQPGVINAHNKLVSRVTAIEKEKGFSSNAAANNNHNNSRFSGMLDKVKHPFGHHDTSNNNNNNNNTGNGNPSSSLSSSSSSTSSDENNK